MKFPFQINRKYWVSGLVFTLLICVSIFIVFSLFSIGSEKISAQMKLNLENQGRLLAQQIDLSDYKKLIDDKKSTDGSPFYNKVVKKLKESHDVVKDHNRFVYTLLYQNNKVMFGLDTSDYGDHDVDGVEDHSMLFSEYKDVPEEVKTAFLNNQTSPILTSVYNDQWGSFVSYYHPLIYKGEFLGFLGIDMNVSVFTKDINDLKKSLIITFSILILLSILIGLSIFSLLYKFKNTYNTELKLQQAQQELEMAQMSKLAALGELSSIITHEINNPLQAIAANAEMIELYSSNPKAISKIGELSKNITNASDKIIEIIKSTKNLVRNESQDSMEEILLMDIVKNSEALFLDKLKKNGIQYRITIPENTKITCLSGLIQQVILNSVNNSIFAIKDLDVKWIEIKYSSTSTHHLVSIIDSGFGLSSELQQKIKNRFFSTKKNGEGSGLGLSICRKILLKHGGEFYYNSELSNTCFEFKIPKTQAQIKESFNKVAQINTKAS